MDAVLQVCDVLEGQDSGSWSAVVHENAEVVSVLDAG